MNEQENTMELPLNLNEETLPAIEQITRGMPGGFFIYHADENEELIYANMATVRIFGCDSLEEFKEYTGNSFRGLVHPEDLEQVEQSIHSQISQSEEGLDYVEYRAVRKDGSIRWIKDYGRFVHTSLYGDVFYVFVEDATDRDLKESGDTRTIQMAHELLEMIKQLEHDTTALNMVNELLCSSMWSIEFNEQGEISNIDWSNEFRAMLGYHNVTDFPNTLDAWSDLIYEEDKEMVLSVLQGAINDRTGKNSYSTEYRLMTKHRGLRWFRVAGKMTHRKNGTPIAFIGILVDITRQKLTDEVLEKQRRLLEDALKQTHRAKQAKSVFLSNMSHNLRTPMNAITGFTTLAKMDIDNREATSDYLDQIMSAANNLQTLISDLLNGSRTASEDISGNEAPCSLPDILLEMEANVLSEILAKQLKLSVTYEALLHPNVICDRQQLYQALLHIIENAMKFTPSGGEVSIRLSELPGAPEGYGFYLFKVRDTGIGISKDKLEHVFEPHDWDHTASLDESQNMGMSMAITENIIEKMGGSIQVESVEGEGSTFTISVQFRLAEEDKEA